MSRLTRDGTVEPVSRDQILRRERGQVNTNFPCSADHEQDWQPYPLDPYSCHVCYHTYIYIYSKSMDQPGKVASPARGQLNRKKYYFPVRVRSCLIIWSRKTGSGVPSRVSLLISILRLNLVLTYGIPPDFRGGVHLFIYNRLTPSGQSRVYQVSRNCVPMAFTAESPPAQGQ